MTVVRGGRLFMYDIVEGIHKALRIESTWAFVLVVALGAGLVGGFFAWVIDVGYRNSAEYKAEHPPKTQAVTPNNSPAQSVTATTNSQTPTESPAQAQGTVTPKKQKPASAKASQPTYSITNPAGSIVNQNSPNLGSQTVINEPPDREWKISTSQKSLLCSSPATARIFAVDSQEAIRFSYKIADVLVHCGWHVPEMGTCQYARTINGVWVQSNSADPSTPILLGSMEGDFPVKRSDFQEFAVGWVVINIGDHGAIKEGDTLPPCTMANITGGYRSDHAEATVPAYDNSVHIGPGAKVDQSSTGPCSPNIIGGSPTVNCAPPPPPPAHVTVCVSPPRKVKEGNTEILETILTLTTDSAIDAP